MNATTRSHWMLSMLRTGLMILPAFFILYLLRFELIVPTNVLELVTGLLFVNWIACLWKGLLPKPRWPMHGLWKAVILFLLAATIASFWLGDLRALGIWKGWFMAPFAYFLMLVSTFRSDQDIRDLATVSIAAMALTSAVMVWQYVVGSFAWLQYTYDQRLVWPFVNFETGEPLSANYVAFLFSPFLCMALVMLSSAKSRVDRSFYGLASLMMVLAIFLTKSYGAWAALLGTAIIASVSFWKHRRWLLVAVPTVILTLGAGLYFSQQGSIKLDFFYRNSIQERVKIWDVSWDMIKESPLMGVGPGAFQDRYAEQFEISRSIEPTEREFQNALHPHNIFLMFWLSNGLLGLIAFVALLGSAIWMLPKKWRPLLLTPLLYLLLHGLIDTFYWKNDQAFQFWFLLGLMMIAIQQRMVRGKVEHGMKIGRELGFPTANIQMDIELDKEYGVYMVILKIEKLKKRGLLYYGPRKTKGLPENIVCEITIFDFDEEIYNKEISFTIGKFIRGPMEFDDPKDLKRQIEKDVLVARNIKA